MGLIALEGMQFHAYHGVYGEEQLAGNNFTLDVYIHTSFDQAAAEDDLEGTINYETVFLICQNVMREKTQLLETIAQRIIDKLKHQFNTIQEVSVRVRKENPLPGDRVGSAYIELEDSFVSQCPRCGRPFICYNDENCWCQQEQVLPQTQGVLRQKYKGCLCQNCLKEFAA